MDAWAHQSPVACLLYDVTLPHEYDVIGPIYSSYDPFHTVELIATAFSEIEVAWVIDMSVCRKFPSNFVRDKSRVWKAKSTACFEPRSPRTKNFMKRTYFHCTSRPRPWYFYFLFFFFLFLVLACSNQLLLSPSLTKHVEACYWAGC